MCALRWIHAYFNEHLGNALVSFVNNFLILCIWNMRIVPVNNYSVVGKKLHSVDLLSYSPVIIKQVIYIFIYNFLCIFCNCHLHRLSYVIIIHAIRDVAKDVEKIFQMIFSTFC